jgi:Glycosyl hydrolases family 43
LGKILPISFEDQRFCPFIFKEMFANTQLFFICALAFGISQSLSANSSAEVTFVNGKGFLFDTDGNHLDAYGSKVNYFDGKYYLYGNSFSEKGSSYGIKSYSSIDLINWKYESFLYDPKSKACPGLCGRPHIIYSPKISKYVLWANGGSHGYNVATSSSPSSDFTFLSSPATIDARFSSLQPADFAVEIIDNKGYLVFSALDFSDPKAGSIWPPITQTMHISPLTDDFTNSTMVSYSVSSVANDFIDREAESPDIFMRNGMYYVAASNTCGYCSGTIGVLYRSKSIKGPWIRQIISGYSCGGQVEGVLPLQDAGSGQTNYVWHSTTVPGGRKAGFSGHIFQPLQFNSDNSVKDLDCSDRRAWKVPFLRGSGSIDSGLAATAADSSPIVADYHPVCDSDRFILYQTWTASQSGYLKEVSINIAKSGQELPLMLKVFSFTSLDDLVSPGYKYKTLGSATKFSGQLSYVFNSTFVTNMKDAKITKGQRLGISITAMDYAPFCHLEYSLTDEEKGTHVLFEQGQGQNSWRGADGKTSPVTERVGKGIKFLATMT